MRYKCSLEYAVLCGIILKFLFILSEISNAFAEQGVVKAKTKDELLEEIFADVDSTERLRLKEKAVLAGGVKSKECLQLMEKTVLAGADSNKRHRVMQTLFKEEVKSIFGMGYINATESLGDRTFHCAIVSIKTTLEKFNNESILYNHLTNGNKQLKKEVKDLHTQFHGTHAAFINTTHDEWIHFNTIAARKSMKPRKRRVNNFIAEVDISFSKCLFLMKANDSVRSPMFSSIKDLLQQYFWRRKRDTKHPMTNSEILEFEHLERDFCGTIARSYHLANAITHMYMEKISGVPKSNGNIYFYDALLEIIPHWYLNQTDILFLSMARLALYVQHDFRYDPIQSFYVYNKWKPEAELVVIPVLSNSTECGLMPIAKSQRPPADDIKFDLNDPKKIKTSIVVVSNPTTPAKTFKMIEFEYN